MIYCIKNLINLFTAGRYARAGSKMYTNQRADTSAQLYNVDVKEAKIVGILNTTPDSYFDGGKFDHLEAAVRHASQMIHEGAHIIDIGGESTGPGSKDVSAEEEIARTIDIIKAIRTPFPDQQISIDTYKAEVAKQAIEAGATMVNDVTAGRGDAEMHAVLATSGLDYVMMYSKDETARTTVADKEYDDVLATIKDFLEERIQVAMDAGINQSQIILDPGMGHFISSLPEYSFEVIDRLSELSSLGPLYVSPSRKSFLAGPDNVPPADRLPATIKASVECVKNGALYIRTHDVKEIVEALEDSVDQQSKES